MAKPICMLSPPPHGTIHASVRDTPGSGACGLATRLWLAYAGPRNQEANVVSQQTYSTSDEWRRALGVAEAIKQTCAGLTLEPKMEWLRQVLNESADQMRAAVLWAASQGAPAGKSREALRPL